MNIYDFMQENHIAIFVEVDVKNKIFHIEKTDTQLKSYDLFEQLVLFGTTEKIAESVAGQLLPRIWTQGNTQCAICKLKNGKVACLFYDSYIEAKEHYFYAKALSEKVNTLVQR